ncbi:alpha/beta hydrolase [Stutzerimonas kirkiae]|uniref:alpha/beta hydrolase n=1 Tax=Stutzerimonas kirkiae TaxID=2211392 RepID=UPI001038484E|nr:alpha/beta hydrolase-fold protein [Stutzerimonas kirkiae]TBV06577.1 alpha/beta hydrolase [Stutzerimonas kirkiae]
MKAWVHILSLMLLPVIALAQPDLSRPVGDTLAERGSAHYRFERFALDSADGLRHYRIDLGIPRKAPPAAGYPVAWLLDGNAALAELQEEWLAELVQGDPPLLVMVGYDTALRFDVRARTYDYTPAPAGQEGLLVEDSVRNRAAGGAVAFRSLLEREVRPRVSARYALDSARQTLWGHSYGGLFVLDSLFSEPGGYRHYVAASPALWWQGGLLLDAERRYRELDERPPASLSILRGAVERSAGADIDPRLRDARRQALAAVPADAAEQMARRLERLPGLAVEYREYTGQGHGDTLPLSLRQALRLSAGLNER